MLLLVHHTCPTEINCHLTYYKFHNKTLMMPLNQNTAALLLIMHVEVAITQR